MGTAVKIPTLKDELIEIKNNPEQFLLNKIIEELKLAAANGRYSYSILEYTENIKTYFKEQGLYVYEEIDDNKHPAQLYVTWE